MSKVLDLIGFAFIGGTIYSFLGMGESDFRWPIFWACAAGALFIIIYRKRMKDSATSTV